MRLIFGLIATLFRWVFYLVVLSALGLTALYFPAQSALRKLDNAAATAIETGQAPPPQLSWLQRVGLSGAAQILPLRQPGADTVHEGRMFRDCPDICPEMVELPAGYFLIGLSADRG